MLQNNAIGIEVIAAKIKWNSTICKGTVNNQSTYLKTVGRSLVFTHTSRM